MLPTSRRRCRKLVLINGSDETVETAHNIVDARYHNSVSGVLQEHLKRSLCKDERFQ